MQFYSAKKKKKERKKKDRMWKHKNVNEIPSKGRGGFRKSRFCEGCQSMMVKVDIEIRVKVWQYGNLQHYSVQDAMPNRAIMNQPPPTCLWTDYYRYIPQPPLGSLIVTYLQSIRNQTVKPEDKSTQPLQQNKYFQISMYIQCEFVNDCTNKTWLVVVWHTLKGPMKTRGIIST